LTVFEKLEILYIVDIQYYMINYDSWEVGS
jgi:hypothetical protein